VCSPNSKGLATLLKNAQPPAEMDHNRHKNNWAQSKSGFVPKINQKNEKNGCFERKMGFGMVGDKTGNLGIWVAGGGVLVVGKVAVGGGCGWFFWI
jgi:hypothetical protein